MKKIVLIERMDFSHFFYSIDLENIINDPALKMNVKINLVAKPKEKVTNGVYKTLLKYELTSTDRPFFLNIIFLIVADECIADDMEDFEKIIEDEQIANKLNEHIDAISTAVGFDIPYVTEDFKKELKKNET